VRDYLSSRYQANALIEVVQ